MINVFDQLDGLGIKWKIILDELLVVDVTYKCLRIPFHQFNTDAKKFYFRQVRSLHISILFYKLDLKLYLIYNRLKNRFTKR